MGGQHILHAEIRATLVSICRPIGRLPRTQGRAASANKKVKRKRKQKQEENNNNNEIKYGVIVQALRRAKLRLEGLVVALFVSCFLPPRICLVPSRCQRGRLSVLSRPSGALD